MDDFAYQAARRRMMAARRRRHLLDPRQPRRLALRCQLRDWGWDGPALEAELLRKLGPVTDEERALDARIARENEVMRRALVVLGRGGVDGELRLVEHLERRFGAATSQRILIRTLSDAQLDSLEAWVARCEQRAEGRRHADL
jgi:hypothetical protein